MTHKIYINLDSNCKFDDLSISSGFINPTTMFADVVKKVLDIKRQKSCEIIFYGLEPFVYNLNDINSMFDKFQYHGINCCLVSRLSSPISNEKLKIIKRSTIDGKNNSIYVIYNSIILSNNKIISERFNKLLENDIKCIPLIILTKTLINSITGKKLVEHFISKNIKRIEFQFASFERAPLNDDLIKWLSECYTYYKKINKGKITFDKFNIRMFSRLKQARLGNLKDLETSAVSVGSFGGIAINQLNKCKLCEKCMFEDFYRNKLFVPLFESSNRCMIKIFNRK